MKIHISIITLIIGLSSISLTNNLEYKSNLNINGNWEFEKINIEGKEKGASELNSCGYNDILIIRLKKRRVNYEFDGIEIKGSQIEILFQNTDGLWVKDVIQLNFSIAFRGLEWSGTIVNQAGLSFKIQE